MAIQQLKDSIADIAKYADEIALHPGNTRLVALDAKNILAAVDILNDWCSSVLDPMLERREKAGQHDLDDLLKRVSQIEQAILALQSAGQPPIVRIDERRSGNR